MWEPQPKEEAGLSGKFGQGRSLAKVRSSTTWSDQVNLLTYNHLGLGSVDSATSG